VVGYHQFGATAGMEAASKFSQGTMLSQERLDRHLAKGKDERWSDDTDLVEQEGAARLDFFRAWRSVSRRATLDRTGDVHLLPRDVDSPQHLRQKFARRPHKGPALDVLLPSRGLSYQNQTRILRSLPEDDVVTVLVKAAT
jgi:hypothetical protein